MVLKLSRSSFQESLISFSDKPFSICSCSFVVPASLVKKELKNLHSLRCSCGQSASALDLANCKTTQNQ